MQRRRLQRVREHHWLGKSVMFLEHGERCRQVWSRQPSQEGRVAEEPEDQ